MEIWLWIVTGACFEDILVFICHLGEYIFHIIVIFNLSLVDCIAPPSLTSIEVIFIDIYRKEEGV